MGSKARLLLMMSGSSDWVGWPLTSWVYASHSPLSVFKRPSCSTVTPQLLAKPSAALLGVPSSENAAWIAGPRFSICLSG